jgi:hypothetical protein
LYASHPNVARSARVIPRRLQPLNAIDLPQVRWEHARRVRTQKPIVIEPARFRVQPSLFHMTEIDVDHHDAQQLTQSIRSETSDETSMSMNGQRRVQESIDKQARRMATKDVAQTEINWDAYMFDHMDENTAKYIILKHVHDGTCDCLPTNSSNIVHFLR